MTPPEPAERGEATAGQAAGLELRERLRERFLAAGFHRVGFARAGAVDGDDAQAEAPGAVRFREWIRRGYHGGMEYLAAGAERRSFPGLVLPGVRSVIVAALRYRQPSAYGVASPRADRGEISTYARGTDYHRVLESRLKRLCETLREEHPAGGFRYTVDTGPVLEKAWAERAGVGWIGKNTCSIDEETGSFFFLGVILSRLELPEDPPAVDHCGSCRLCIDACPTEAIVEPYVLDARRCISYLTIELRGAMPPDLEPAVGNLVFGCDICQEVCPWNRPEEPPEADPELAPRPENAFPPLEELAGLSAAAFRERFPRSAVRRAKHRGFLRNVLVALGNSGEPRFLELLDRLSDHDDVRADPDLRKTLERARRRLGEAGHRDGATT